MAATCYNTNDPSFQELMRVYGNELIVSMIIDVYQKNNKTDQFPTTVQAAAVMRELKATPTQALENPVKTIEDNLIAKGFAHRLNGRLYITRSSKTSREASASITSRNTNGAVAYLNANRIYPGTYEIIKKATSSEIVFNRSRLKDYIPVSDSKKNLSTILNHISAVVPGVSIKMVSVSEAKAIHDSIADWQKTDVNFDKVKSFYHQGTAYLIKGRVTDEVAVEEVLHPLVMALSKDNPELYQRLLKEAAVHYPGLVVQIRNAYMGLRNFDSDDMGIELVSQALSRTINKKFDEQGVNEGLLKYINDFLEWFADMVKKIVDTIATDFTINADTRQVTVKVKDLKEDISLDKIASALLTKGLSFDVNLQYDDKVRYNIQDDLRPYVNEKYESATEQQKAVLDAVIFQNPVQMSLIHETHTYMDQDGNADYKSVTEQIKGKLSLLEQARNTMNIFFGNQVDSIVESLVAGKSFEEALVEIDNVLQKTNENRAKNGLAPITKDMGLSEDLARKVYDDMKAFFEDEDNGFDPGAIFVPQVIVSQSRPNGDGTFSRSAGSIDILVINPDGTAEVIDIKSSKNSVMDPAYDNVGYPSSSPLFKGAKFTTKVQHGLQVNTYEALLGNLGVNVVRARTIHIKLDVEGEGSEQTVKDARIEPKIVEHHLGANVANVKKIVDINYDVKGVNENDPLGQDLDEEEARKEAKEDAIDNPELMGSLAEIVDVLEKRRTMLQRTIAQKKGFQSMIGKVKREASLNKLSVLISSVKEDMEGFAILNGTQLNKAIGEIVRYALEDISEFENYVSDPAKASTPNFATIILGYSKFLESYRDITAIGNLANTANQLKMNELAARIKHANILLDQAFTDFATNFVLNNTMNEGLTKEDVQKLLQKTVDISVFDLEAESMAASNDTVLALIDKIYKNKKAQVAFELDEFVAEAREQGNLLIAASKAAGISEDEAYKFMFSKGADGKLNGRYVQKIGSKYWDKLFALRKDTLNEKGEPASYINTANLTGKELDDAIIYNKKLFAAKRAFMEFNSAEKYTDEGIKDGDYHRYSDEFKRERAKHEEYVGYWRRKAGVTPEEYARYVNKYKIKSQSYLKPVMVDGKFTGQTQTVPGRFFVRSEYIEKQEYTPEGSMLDPEYEKIMNPTDALGRARKEYFEWWVNTHEKGSIGMLPADVESSAIGKIPRIQKNLVEKIKGMDEGRGAAVLKMIGNFLNPLNIGTKVYARTYFQDEDGTPVRQPPMFYLSDLKSEYRVNQLKDKIKELTEKRKNNQVTQAEYTEEMDTLKRYLKIEESKVSADTINTDMTQNLIAFRTMAANFEALNAIEDTVLTLQKTLEKREYTPYGAELSKKITPGGKQTLSFKGDQKESNIQKRLRYWLDMTFYDEGAFEKSVAVQVVSAVQKYTSLTYVGFNPFSALNNVVYGRISNALETAGGQFYNRKAMMRATRDWNLEALPGLMQGLGSVAAMKTGPDKYANYIPKSKYEAMVSYFKMIRKYESGEGRQGIPDVLGFAYWMQEGGEYMIQSKTGMALLMSQQVSNPETGETLSIYDALDFDSATGKVTIKEGFQFDDSKRADITRQIWGMNEYIHGNYAYEDRMAIQRYALGNLAAQFHKWVYPAFKARFKSRSFDERFGVYTEGRYNTVVQFLKYAWGAHGNIKEKFDEAKGLLTEDQVANMYKILAELAFFIASIVVYKIFSMLKDGVDDDDKELKRLLGLLQQQSDRTQSEITTFLDPTEYARVLANPIASSRSLGEAAEAATFTASYLFNPGDESQYYVKGERKGDPKFIKQLEDALPIMREINRWKAFNTTETWYVKK